MDMHARYIEVCSGVQNRLSDWLERRGQLSTIFTRARELEIRWSRKQAWAWAWDRYTEMFPATPDAGAAGGGK